MVVVSLKILRLFVLPMRWILSHTRATCLLNNNEKKNEQERNLHFSSAQFLSRTRTSKFARRCVFLSFVACERMRFCRDFVKEKKKLIFFLSLASQNNKRSGVGDSRRGLQSVFRGLAKREILSVGRRAKRYTHNQQAEQLSVPRIVHHCPQFRLERTERRRNESSYPPGSFPRALVAEELYRCSRRDG